MAQTNLRRAELAGSWYPGDRLECLDTLEAFAAEIASEDPPLGLVAGIVPHAGWYYSGALAYEVIAQLAAAQPELETVVLFSGHLSPQGRASVLAEGACETPLGPIEVDAALAQAVLERAPGALRETPSRHSQDNSAELQFPLIRHCLPQARLLCCGAPPSGGSEVLAEAVLSSASALGRKLAVVGSTDLSHYGPNYRWEPQGRGAAAERWVRETNDRRFIEACVAMERERLVPLALSEHNACCAGSALAAIRCAQELGASSGALLRYCTSADRRPSTSFVGYAAIGFAAPL